MKLESIYIESFKSVINQEISLVNNCVGFIGLNESGKTNVLKAINFLDKNLDFSIKDRSKINKELPIIKYYFSVTDQEIDSLLKKLDAHFEHNYDSDFLKGIVEKLSIENIEYVRQLKYDEIEIQTESKINFDFNFSFNKDIKLLKDDNSIADDVSITIDGNEKKLNECYFLNETLISSEHRENFTDIDIEWLRLNIEKVLKKSLLRFLPEVQFWKYDSKYLVPAEIDYDAFVANGDPYENNAPLFNMLLISSDLDIYNVGDVLRKVEEWKTDSSSRRKDSNILTRDINKHIKKIWQDYDQELNIELEENTITIHVKDPNCSNMNFYDMNARSQGFKTFISFILTVSAEVETGLLENYVLILDEPETHLHPSGVKYMKEELHKLASNNNNVFFATHSIFMIDRSNLSNHIIVKKQNEQTKLNRVQRNNILQEEVVYQALGTSLDEFSIAKKNILFEGELDVQIFKFFLDNCLTKKENTLSDYELLDGGGTKNIHKFFKDKYIPKDSQWILILDKDSPGRELKSKIEKEVLPEVFKNISWIYYSEINDHELEDILPVDLIQESFLKASKEMALEEKFEINFEQEKPISKIIDEYYGRNRINGQVKSKFEELFKINLDGEVESYLDLINKETSIKNKLAKFEEVLPSYFTFISKVLELFDIKVLLNVSPN